MDRVNELALFAGAGGGILGSQLLGHRIVCAVEYNEYCQEVLLQRQRDGVLEPFPIWSDAFTFDGRPWRGVVDLITAGFPCQPFSIAGSMRAEDDPKNGWPATARIISEVLPRELYLENVSDLASFEYFGRILGELAALGYDLEWGCLSAASVGAPHRRNRIWIYGNTDSNSEPARPEYEKAPELSQMVANSDRAQRKRGCLSIRRQERHADPSLPSWWEVEPRLDRVADGVAHQMDRLRALGNGQVPAVVKEAYKQLKRRS